MNDEQLANEIENTKLDRFTHKQRQQIIAALRREPDSCWTTCSDCGFLYGEYHGHIIPCPRCSVEKNLRERPTSGEMVMVRALQMCREYAANEKIDRRYLGELIEVATGSALSAAEAEGRKT